MGRLREAQAAGRGGPARAHGTFGLTPDEGSREAGRSASYGQAALDPELLLLDEPFEGLSPAIVPTVAAGIGEITERGRAILLAESNIHHVPDFATRLYVIERGEIIFAGAPDEVRRDAGVLRVIGGHVI